MSCIWWSRLVCLQEMSQTHGLMPPPADYTPPSETLVSTNQLQMTERARQELVRCTCSVRTSSPTLGIYRPFTKEMKDKLFVQRLGVWSLCGCRLEFDAVFATDYQRCKMRQALARQRRMNAPLYHDFNDTRGFLQVYDATGDNG